MNATICCDDIFFKYGTYSLGEIMKILLLALLLTSCASTKMKRDKIQGLNHDGENISINLKEKDATILIFMSSRCPCSDSHSDIVKDLSNKFKDYNFVGIHSNYNERLKHAKKYFSSKDYSFPIIHDKDSVLAKEFGAVKTPHSYILNNKGEVIYSGSVTDSTNGRKSKENFLLMALTDIKQGLAPRKAKRKVLGCYIPIKE